MSLVPLDPSEEIPMDEVLVWKFPLPSEHLKPRLAVRKMGVDLSEKLSVQQRAVLVACAPGHSKMVAKTIQRLPHARKLAASQLQSINNVRKGIEAAQREFGVQEAEIEDGVMSHKRRVGDERHELLGALSERRRRAKHFIGQAMNGDSLGRHRPPQG